MNEIDAIVSKMRSILLKQVVPKQNAIIALRSRERSEGSDLAKEIKEKQAEVDELRLEYKQLADKLIQLDRVRANEVIKENKTLLAQLEENYKQDLADAKIGTWWEEK